MSEFFREKSGQLSSVRLINFFIIISTLIDWQHAVWLLPDGVWHPEYQVIGLIFAALGTKVLQKNLEK